MLQLKISQTITSRSEESVNRYFDEIAKIKMITPDEEVALSRIIHSDKVSERERDKARNTLVNANLRFVVSCAKKYQQAGVALMDLIQEGNMGLIKAANEFDETKGFKFISYAVWWIRQGIMQYISECGKNIRMPLNKVQMLNKIYKAQANFLALNGREASADEISEICQIDVEQVQKVLDEAQAQQITSIDATLTEDSDTTFEAVYVVKDADTTDKKLNLESVSTEIQQVLANLTEKEQYVLCHEFGLGGALQISRSEIAEDLNLSTERVRQLRANALRKLKTKYGEKLRLLL